MKNGLIAVFLFGGLVLSIRNFWFAADYLLHRSTIIELFCENRDKPDLHCDGKCYLAQKLWKKYQDAQSSDHAERQARTDLGFLFYFFESTDSETFILQTNSQDQLCLQYFAVLKGYIKTDTPPPQA